MAEMLEKALGYYKINTFKLNDKVNIALLFTCVLDL